MSVTNGNEGPRATDEDVQALGSKLHGKDDKEVLAACQGLADLNIGSDQAAGGWSGRRGPAAGGMGYVPRCQCVPTPWLLGLQG